MWGKTTKMLPRAVFNVGLKRKDPGKKGTAEIGATYDLGEAVIKHAYINIHCVKAKKLKMLQYGMWSSSVTACR
jgi:hypothetical protein